MATPTIPVTRSDRRAAATMEHAYELDETRKLVELVDDAAEVLARNGEPALSDFRATGSRWRQGESYVFVLDRDGSMLVHPDPALEGKTVLDLEDVNGRPIIRGLIAAATARPDKPHGWYHYQWPVPGGLLPRWKSSYVRLVPSPSGTRYIVGSGMYDDRMERAFVVDVVTNAVAEIEKRGEAAFALFRDPTGPFIMKDTYVFVNDTTGVELVSGAFPQFEGGNYLDLRDTHGKYLNREMIQVVQRHGSGWVDYMWPKPGESVSTRKSAYVQGVRLGGKQLIVGCGVYLPGAPKDGVPRTTISAAELMRLVREGAAVLQDQGEMAYPEFRRKGSKWFGDQTYFFVFAPDGTRVFHAADPDSEGQSDAALMDVVGRPFVRMMLDAGVAPSGEGWVHYMYPEPGNLFPTWKSAFVKRITFPSGTPRIVGCGIYNMKMDQAFIEDVVNRAAALIEERGRDAFELLRDRTGPFVFMDTYVFAQSPDGTELVNAGMPSLEGRNLMEVKDLRGRAVIREQIDAAMKDGSAWLDMYWYTPGDNTPARKRTFVRKVQCGGDTFIVGSGIYLDDPARDHARGPVTAHNADSAATEARPSTTATTVSHHRGARE